MGPKDEGVLDEICALLNDFGEVDGWSQADRLLTESPHLRSKAQELLRGAREVAVIQAYRTPTVPGYTLGRMIGRGGMGEVYLSRQDRVGNRVVALKLLPEFAFSSRARSQFRSEALALAKLKHPNIVSIYDVIDDGRTLAYAMEFIDGASLKEVIQGLARRAGADPLRRIHEILGNGDFSGSVGEPNNQDRTTTGFFCRVVLLVARALAAVHRAGLLHRDVKPSNILLRADGAPLLADFGLAKNVEPRVETTVGAFAGTVFFASPEQLRGKSKDLDERSDVYSLGATLFFCLTKRLPYLGSSGPQLLAEIERERDPFRESDRAIPRDLKTIVRKAMTLDVEDRYPDADAFADDLERQLAFRPIHARTAGPMQIVWKAVRRNRRLVAGTIAGAVISGLLVLGGWVYSTMLPVWTGEALREARLSLLSPFLSDQILASTYWDDRPDAPAFKGQRAEATRRLYERRMLHLPWADPGIEVERQLVELAFKISESLGESTQPAPILRERAPLACRYAQEWSASRSTPEIGEETFRSAHPDDLRSLGFLAFLCRDFRLCLKAWDSLDRSSKDGLVHLCVGQMNLVVGEPEKAFVALGVAAEEFPDVGHVIVSYAEAAVRCGEKEIAKKLLEQADQLQEKDPFYQEKLARAELLALEGKDEKALKIYAPLLAFNEVPRARLSYAGFLISRNRLGEATRVLSELVAIRENIDRYDRLFVETADRWWTNLDPNERLRVLVLGYEEHTLLPGGLRGALRSYEELAIRYGSPGEISEGSPIIDRLGSPSDDGSWQNAIEGVRRVFGKKATAADIFSALPLQGSDLTEVAKILEVQDMAQWHAVRSYPRFVRSLVLLERFSCSERISKSVFHSVGAALVELRPRFQKIRRSLGSAISLCFLAFLPTSNTAEASTLTIGVNKISDGYGLPPGALNFQDEFGISVAYLGDLDGPDGPSAAALAVGSSGDLDSSNGGEGSVWVFFLDEAGTVLQNPPPQVIGDVANDGKGGQFGLRVAGIGDLDGDGVTDLAVSADRVDSDPSPPGLGDVWIFFLNGPQDPNDPSSPLPGTVKGENRISTSSVPFDRRGHFGGGLTFLGDLDGPGPSVGAIAVGADTQNPEGAFWIFFLDGFGCVIQASKIANGVGGMPSVLNPNDAFGGRLESIGDLDGDGVPELAVPAFLDDDGHQNLGALWILFMERDGTVKQEDGAAKVQKISAATTPFLAEFGPQDTFGDSVGALGDFDGDGIPDVAVGSRADGDGGFARGAVWFLFLNRDGTVKATQKVSDLEGGFSGHLDDTDGFGNSIVSLRDLDGSSSPSSLALAVGTRADDDGGTDRGAVWILFLDEPATAGTVRHGDNSIANVLRVNGQVGTVPVAPNSPITICLDSPPSGAGNGSYVFWAWPGPPTGLFPLSPTLGCSVNPTPIHPLETPQPLRCLSKNVPAVYCPESAQVGFSPPRVPWSVTRARGLSRNVVFTLQAMVEDEGCLCPSGYSVSNVIVLEIR